MDYEKIGKFIQMKRKEKGLTQEDLANKLSITDRAVSKWERGKGCPDISLIEKLSSILDVSVLEILHGEKVKDENKVIIDMVKKSKKKMNILTITLLIILNTVLVILLYLNIHYFFYTRIISIGGDTRVVRNTNMIGSLNPYDIIKYNKRYSYDNIKIGDIIVKKVDDYVIASRVKEIIRNNNEIIMKTKGDFNEDDDVDLLTKEKYLGKVVRVYSGLANKYSSTDGKMPILTFILYNAGIIGILIIDIGEYRKKKIIIM